VADCSFEYGHRETSGGATVWPPRGRRGVDRCCSRSADRTGSPPSRFLDRSVSSGRHDSDSGWLRGSNTHRRSGPRIPSAKSSEAPPYWLVDRGTLLHGSTREFAGVARCRVAVMCRERGRLGCARSQGAGGLSGQDCREQLSGRGMRVRVPEVLGERPRWSARVSRACLKPSSGGQTAPVAGPVVGGRMEKPWSMPSI
jgi:hypothetical protein